MVVEVVLEVFECLAQVPPGSNSPLNAPAGLTASVSNFTVTVGGGSAPNPTASGGTLLVIIQFFSTITSTGGGAQNTPSSPGPSGRDVPKL